MVAFVPSKNQNQTAAYGPSAAGVGSVSAGGSGSGTGAGGGSALGASSGSPTGQQAAAGGGGAGTATNAGGTASAPTGGAAAVAAQENAAGNHISRAGVDCSTPGARQMTWTAYAPACVPAFTGKNGGATAPGVTASTITLVYRESNAPDSQAFNAESGAAGAGTNATNLADMQTYAAFFNKQFELYGRHVVIKAFVGQGDPLMEDQGQDEAGAQADAVTAKSMGAFGDVPSDTQPYQEALAAQGIMGFGGVYMSKDWFANHAPYEYAAVYPDDISYAYGTVSTICHRMINLPANFAGDVVFQHEKRVFGELNPENPVYQEYGNTVQSYGASACGLKLAKRISYALNVSTAEQQAVGIVAQLKAAGVTTVICGCDPLIPVFLSQAADQQDYHPEWMSLWWGDAYGRLPASDQWSHSIETGVIGQSIPKAQDESYRVYKMANPGGEPAEQYYLTFYLPLLQVFEGLQAAGPDLTPTTFERGIQSVPDSLPSSQYGIWHYGPGIFMPASQFKIAWWNPNAVSGFDNKTGAFVDCNGGTRYPWKTSTMGSGQLNCFGH